VSACEKGCDPITEHQGFGEVLRGHRRAARLTLEQLAAVSGVSARALSDMERGRSKGPQHRTVTALADALVLAGDDRKQFIELARDGRLRDHWSRPAGVCELPRLVDDFTGRAAELAWMRELAYAESSPGAGVAGLITSSGGMGKTTLAVRAAHELRPSFPGGVLFLDLLGMSPGPMAAGDALRLLLRALGAADEQVPGDIQGRASLYRSLLRDTRALIVLDNAGSEDQVRPLLPGESPSRAVITSKRLLAGLEGVRRLTLGPLALPEAAELLIGILGERGARDEESALTRLAQLCEGLPLALRIISRPATSRSPARSVCRTSNSQIPHSGCSGGWPWYPAGTSTPPSRRSRAGCRPGTPGTRWTSSLTWACCWTAPRAVTGSMIWSASLPVRGLTRSHWPSVRH
jgi:transcriptional regulator with XRE-family HTH domain